MRRRALESDVIIVNHHLFFADLAIKQQAKAAPDAGVLPEAAAVIFDEAHELEDIASSYFGISLSNVRVEELVRDVGKQCCAPGRPTPPHSRAAETLCASGRGCSLARSPRPAVSRQRARMPFEQREQFLEAHGDLYLAVTNALHRMEGELERLRGVEESLGLKKRVADIREHLRFLMEAESVNTVFWIERRGGSVLRQGVRNTYLQATPIDVSELLSELLFEQYPSVILTSATLTVQGGFAHLRKRLGLRDARELIVPSHFRYEEQALLYLPPGMPDPREPTFGAQAARTIRRVLDITRGRALSLFTAISRCAICMSACCRSWIILACCRARRPAKRCWRNFATQKTQCSSEPLSFWQGVDVQGEALSCVIVDRLPFSVPTDPVVSGAHARGGSQRSQSFFRLPGAGGGDHFEAGLRAVNPLPRRSRRVGAARFHHRAATVLGKVFSREPSALPSDPRHYGSGTLLRGWLKKLQIPPLRYAPVEMTTLLGQKICHLRRPGPVAEWRDLRFRWSGV